MEKHFQPLQIISFHTILICSKRWSCFLFGCLLSFSVCPCDLMLSPKKRTQVFHPIRLLNNKKHRRLCYVWVVWIKRKMGVLPHHDVFLFLVQWCIRTRMEYVPHDVSLGFVIASAFLKDGNADRAVRTRNLSSYYKSFV